MPDRSEQLVISSRFEQLEMVIDRAQEFFSAETDDEELLYRIVLVTSEAVTNAIEHGNELDTSKSVAIEFIVTGGTLELWVEDEGKGFSPRDVEDPLAEENLLEDGGRGIFLMEQLADEVKFERGGRRVGLIFNRSDGAS